jgi:FkbM family methyltransferase
MVLKLYREIRRRLRLNRTGHGTDSRSLGHIALNKDCNENQIVLRPGLKLTISPGSRIPFEYFCFRDEEMIREFDCFIDVSRTKSRLLDVGALHGIFSLAFTFGRSGATAMAVDPSPVAFTKLVHNQSSNPSCSIKSFELALSDREQIIQMYFEWEHLRTVGNASPDSNPVKVYACTGDAVCKKEGFEPDVIKIDVEGYECRVLSGLSHTIEEFRPVVFIEIHPDMLADYGDTPADLVQFFRTHKYGFRDLSKAEMSDDEIRGLTSIRRIIAVPGEKEI